MKDFGCILVSNHIAVCTVSSFKDSETLLQWDFTSNTVIHIYPFKLTRSIAQSFTLRCIMTLLEEDIFVLGSTCQTSWEQLYLSSTKSVLHTKKNGGIVCHSMSRATTFIDVQYCDYSESPVFFVLFFCAFFLCFHGCFGDGGEYLKQFHMKTLSSGKIKCPCEGGVELQEKRLMGIMPTFLSVFFIN